MEPYYSDDFATIYHGDCREVLSEITADVAITDPPYNVGIAYGDGTNDTRSDYAEWCGSWFRELRSKCRVVALTPGIANVGLWTAIEEPLWMVAWNKPAAMGRAPLGFNNWEPVLVWGEPKRPAFADAFTAPLVTRDDLGDHPCPKPLKWGTWLVGRLTSESDVVVDPFVGSGTVLVAAKQAGRKCVGIEVEERFCELAAKRLAQEVLDFGGVA